MLDGTWKELLLGLLSKDIWKSKAAKLEHNSNSLPEADSRKVTALASEIGDMHNSPLETHAAKENFFLPADPAVKSVPYSSKGWER